MKPKITRINIWYKALNLIEEAEEEKETVLVHCAGMARSSAVLVAYIN